MKELIILKVNSRLAWECRGELTVPMYSQKMNIDLHLSIQHLDDSLNYFLIIIFHDFVNSFYDEIAWIIKSHLFSRFSFVCLR